jgi:hypothetical protein
MDSNIPSNTEKNKLNYTEGVISHYENTTGCGNIMVGDESSYSFKIEDWQEQDMEPMVGLDVIFMIGAQEEAKLIYCSEDNKSQKDQTNFLTWLSQTTIISGIGIIFLIAGVMGIILLRQKQITDIEKAKVIIESIDINNSDKSIEGFQKNKELAQQASNLVNQFYYYPGSPRDQAQRIVGMMERKLQVIKKQEDFLTEQNEAVQSAIDSAGRLAQQAIDIAKDPPHKTEVWQKSEAKWQEAIEILTSAPSDSSLDNVIDMKKKEYWDNLLVIQNAIKSQLLAESSYNSSLKSAEKAFLLTKNSPNNMEAWIESLNNWQQAINDLKKVPSNTTLSKNAEEKIIEYQKSLSIIDEKIKSMRLEKDKRETEINFKVSADDLISSYINTVGDYDYTPGIDDVSFLCSGAESRSSIIPGRVEKHAVIWSKTSGNIATYQLRLEINSSLYTFTFYLKKSGDKICIDQIKSNNKE